MEAITALLLQKAPEIAVFMITVFTGIYAAVAKSKIGESAAAAAKIKVETEQIYVDMVNKSARIAIGYVAERNADFVKSGLEKLSSTQKAGIAVDYMMVLCKSQNIKISTNDANMLITAMLATIPGEGATGDSAISVGAE